MAQNINSQWMKWDLKKFSDTNKGKFRDFMTNLERHMHVFDVPERNRTFILGYYLKEGSLAKSIYNKVLADHRYIRYTRIVEALREEFDNNKTQELDALKFMGINQKRSENVTQYLMRLLSPFGQEIPAEMQQLVKAKFKKGLRKQIKNALVACDDLELYELARKARNIEQELDSSSESSSSSNSDSSSESDDSDSESEKKKKKRTKKNRGSKSRKESKTDKELRKIKKVLAQLTAGGHYMAPETHKITDVPEPAIPNNNNTITNKQNPQYHCPRCFRSNHQLSECFAFNDAYHRPIAGPPPCQKPMAGNNEQHNSNT